MAFLCLIKLCDTIYVHRNLSLPFHIELSKAHRQGQQGVIMRVYGVLVACALMVVYDVVQVYRMKKKNKHMLFGRSYDDERVVTMKTTGSRDKEKTFKNHVFVVVWYNLSKLREFRKKTHPTYTKVGDSSIPSGGITYYEKERCDMVSSVDGIDVDHPCTVAKDIKYVGAYDVDVEGSIVLMEEFLKSIGKTKREVQLDFTDVCNNTFFLQCGFIPPKTAFHMLLQNGRYRYISMNKKKMLQASLLDKCKTLGSNNIAFMCFVFFVSIMGCIVYDGRTGRPPLLTNLLLLPIHISIPQGSFMRSMRRLLM